MNEIKWERLALLSDLGAAGGVMAATVDRFKLALYLVGDVVYATADMCTHGGARLSEGYLEGHVIECPLHQGRFDVRTGAVAGPPCKRPVRSFPVRLDGDVVLVGVPSETPAPPAEGRDTDRDSSVARQEGPT